ncbi:MAG TPA: hypothetical protein VM901_05265 [Bdellovibrionota bacterium]|nr:hypothetical protein [Bdellovibrionota bacterium]
MLLFGVFLIAYWILRLWLAAFSGVHPDEAYYWVWSLKPALGYYDHPPMIAWVISASRNLAALLPFQFTGQNAIISTQMGLRLLPYFLSCVVTPFFIGWTIVKVQKQPLRLTQMFALMTSLTFVFGPIVITPDTPLFAAWTVALFLLVTLLRGHNKNFFPGDPVRFSWPISVALGFALAFAAYSKYSAILLAASLVITGLGLWNSLVAGVVSLVLVSPYVWWNLSPAARDMGGGVFFQFSNATNPLTNPINWARVGDLWAAQLFLWGPVVFLGAFVFLFTSARRLFSSERRSTLSGTLFVWAILPLLFFSITGLRRQPEANWALVGCVGASVLTLSRLYSHGLILTLTTAFNSLVLLVASVIFFNPAALGVAVPEGRYPELTRLLSKDPRFFEFQHWDSLRSSLFEATLNTNEPILVETYQKLSALLFMDDAAAQTEKIASRLKIWKPSRRSQYHVGSEFTIDESSSRYWLLLNEKTKRPANCRFYQQLFRGENPTEVNALYRCNQ